MSRGSRTAASPIETLIREHDVIQRVLYLLDVVADILSRDVPVPEGFQPWVVEFFRDFADRFHHAKEEGLLFPVLARRPGPGGSSEDAVARLLREHVECRALVTQLSDLDLTAAAGRGQFATVARTYVGLLRSHIFRENNETFAAAERASREEELLELRAAFEAADAANGGGGRSALLLSEIGRWESRLWSVQSDLDSGPRHRTTKRTSSAWDPNPDQMRQAFFWK
jgi:hemerythrin-like domain-containing protein